MGCFLWRVKDTIVNGQRAKMYCNKAPLRIDSPLSVDDSFLIPEVWISDAHLLKTSLLETGNKLHLNN